MKKKVILKVLALLPHFLFRRIVKLLYPKTILSTQNTYEEIISNQELLKEKLFDLKNEDSYFLNELSRSSCYGEYGCGLTTIYAVRELNKPTISVDTSLDWVNKVKESNNSNLLNISYVNLGEVGSFGRPINYDLRENIKEYLDIIWQQKNKPDFVLIDGRFRVAAFLTSLKYAKKGTVICFDDYMIRPHYKIVEIFEKPYLVQDDNSVFFRCNKEYDIEKLNYYISKFEYVMD